MNTIINSFKNYGLKYTLIKVYSFIFNKFLTKLINYKTKQLNLHNNNMIIQKSANKIYNKYLKDQIDRSFDRSSYKFFFLNLTGSRDKLIKNTVEKLNSLHLEKENVLSIGCRE